MDIKAMTNSYDKIQEEDEGGEEDKKKLKSSRGTNEFIHPGSSNNNNNNNNNSNNSPVSSAADGLIRMDIEEKHTYQQHQQQQQQPSTPRGEGLLQTNNFNSFGNFVNPLGKLNSNTAVTSGYDQHHQQQPKMTGFSSLLTKPNLNIKQQHSSSLPLSSSPSQLTQHLMSSANTSTTTTTTTTTTSTTTNTTTTNTTSPLITTNALNNYYIPAPKNARERLKEFKQIRVIGTGTFGKVYLVQNINDKRFYAMKCLNKANVVQLKQVEHLNSEKSILASVNHPFIVNLYQAFQDEVKLYLLFEYVAGGEVFTHLRKTCKFSNSVAKFYAAEIILALEFLHKQNIVYRDLKPENLLIDTDGHIKITDFGFAKRVEDRTFTLCGTPEYLAPEVIQSKGHGKAVDWWALGILIFEMLAGYPPFYDDDTFVIYNKILAGRITFPIGFDLDAKDLIKRLLTADRTRRLGALRDGAQDVKNHRWFVDINWDDLYQRKYKGPFVPNIQHQGDSSNFEYYDEEPMIDDPPPPDFVDPYAHYFKDF
ncbi:cAMP-dependent protein kinase [Tieghemostelium lacteum]|uniref:cAMP-dependent protein kinase n=1 Tax=Tieghemostelium lacteum TaxID=361077 RepID=A0A152A4N5_TIELA|nr:cAMP-dependent protein kinase [Tieghemostelium lacteum]|eukprot:KYR01199.1 cAMP-dependent protein kinase [Tieghemostelium lacteum]